MSKLMRVLFPLHAAIGERVAVLDKQPASPRLGVSAVNNPVEVRPPMKGQSGTDLVGLCNTPQLITIFQVDRELALTLKAVLDLCEEADFSGAARTLEAAAQRARQLDLDTRCDAKGIVHRRDAETQRRVR